jgi:hypothetical protein
MLSARPAAKVDPMVSLRLGEENILFRDLSPDFVDNYLPKSHVGCPKNEIGDQSVWG